MDVGSLSENELKHKADIVRVKLINQIRRSTHKYAIFYQVLSDSCGFEYNMGHPPDRKTFGQILGFLLREEYKVGRPLLTSIIYLSGQYIQGNGFFKLLHAENILSARRYTLEELKEYTFRRKLEKEAVDFWRDASSYKKFKKQLNLE